MIDTHAHLNDKRLFTDIEQIISEMHDDNLSAIITVGYDRKSSEDCYKISQKYSDVYCAVGIHPHDAKTAKKEDYERFSQLIKDDKVVAIGEIGLDFHYDFSPRDVQQRVFLEQLELAHFLKAPVIIHLRDAYQVMYNLLRQNKHLLEYGAVLHCYSGSKEMLREYQKLGLFVSFGGSITFKNAVDKPDVVRETNLDMMMLETDCPYLTPAPFRGKTNYPKYVNLVAKKVAEFLQKSYTEIDEITTKNAKSFFGIK
ncbi:MAG: TatD family hydrolase [Clostridiales bacterium]|nr:TatD family hydrolase [Clostridiales bacterium]